MNKNTCPLCRRSMRLWALDARQALSEEVTAICVRTAISFRDECLHAPADFVARYELLTARLVAVMRNTKSLTLTPTEIFEASAPLQREIEQIKNRFNGHIPKPHMEKAA